MRRLWMTGFIAAVLLLGLSYARQRLEDPADLVFRKTSLSPLGFERR